jgi:hypothetical protein
MDRGLVASPIFDDAELLQLWMYLLMNVAYEDRKEFHGGKVIKVKKGQMITSRKELAVNLSTTENKVYARLTKLKVLGSINITSNNKYSVITVVNWGKYQDKRDTTPTANQQQTNSKPTANQQPIIKRNKEIKNIYITHTHAHARGEYQNVYLSDNDFERLVAQFGEQRCLDSIECLSRYISEHPDYNSENHFEALRGWVQDRLSRATPKAKTGTKKTVTESEMERKGFNVSFEDMFERA